MIIVRPPCLGKHGSSQSNVYPKEAVSVIVNSTQHPIPTHLTAPRNAGYTHINSTPCRARKCAKLELRAHSRAAEIEAAKWRTWQTADGKFKVEAKFVKCAFGTLTLEKKDSTTVDVNLDILCPDDQEFVKRRKWTRPESER